MMDLPTSGFMLETATSAEAQRLAVLDSYDILDTPPERAFDELVEMVSELLEAPMAAVNLIAADRQWSKSQIGFGTHEMSLETAFCSRTIREPNMLIVPDATCDERFAESALVTSGPHLRFYAGEVLHSREGQPLGAFCIGDTTPRPNGLDPRQRAVLRTLARQVVGHLERRRAIIERDAALAEQRRIAQKHRADADFLRAVLAASDNCVEVLDLDGRSIFMNDRGMRLIGLRDHEEIRGVDWRVHWQGDARDAADAAIAAVHAGRTGRFVAQHVRSPKWWDVQLTPILDAAGRPDKMLSVARDITAIRASEKALGEALSLNSAIMTANSDLIVVLGLDGTTEFISPGGIAALEISDPGPVLGQSAMIGLSGDDLRQTKAAFEEAKSGRQSRFQLFRNTAKGTPKWWDCVISPLPGPDGRPERLVAVSRDISVLKQTENRLARSEERLNLALGASDMVGLWDWELGKDIVYADANLARMYDLDPALATQGLHISEYIKRNLPQDQVDPKVSHELLEHGMEEHRREFRVRRADGSIRWLWSRGVPVRDARGNAVRLPGATVDITERKAVEAALREANERLEKRVATALAERAEIEEALRQSQKMEAVGQLTGGLAHDFNNLLASIGGALEIMQTRIAQGRLGNLGRYIDAAQGAARRASALTHRLLAFSRRQTLDPRPTDVNQLVAGMQELIGRTAGPEVNVEVMAEPALSNALIDPNQLENALLNLCINARDAMPGGGRLTIRTANHRLEEAAARDADVPPGLYTQLVVSDTGTGMPPEIVSRAFDPFFTTKPLGMGTGLGLSMVYGFVRQSGGMIAIDSVPGEGTSVRLHLPRYLGPAEDNAPAPGTGAPVQAESGETILVVDDEPSLRMLVAEVLQERGYCTLEAEDGAAGLRLLRSPARIDLLLTDVGLPGGINGRQLADAARSLRPGLKVMFITGYAEHAALNDGNLEPGMEVLTKPFAMEALATRIRCLVKRS